MPRKKSSLSQKTRQAKKLQAQRKKESLSPESAEERELRLYYMRVLHAVTGAHQNSSKREKHIKYCRAYNAALHACKTGLDLKLALENFMQRELKERDISGEWVNIQDLFDIENDSKQEVLDQVESGSAHILSNADETAHLTLNIKTESPLMSTVEEETAPVLLNVDKTAHLISNIKTEPPVMSTVEEETAPVVLNVDKTAPVMSNVDSETTTVTSNVDSETAHLISNIKTEPLVMSTVEGETTPFLLNVDKTASFVSNVDSETAPVLLNVDKSAPVKSNLQSEGGNILLKWFETSPFVTDNDVDILLKILKSKKRVNEDTESVPALKKSRLEIASIDTEVTPVSSDKCNFKSTSKRLLKRHLLRRKGENLFACENCDFTCKSV